MPIRPATLAEVPAIVALQRQIHAEHIAWDAARWTTASPADQSYGRWVDALLNEPGAGLVLLAEIDDAVVGYLVAELIEESTHHWSPRTVYLHDIYVASTHRRQGLARSLMTTLLDWSARTHPGVQLRLTTATQNDAGRAFFASFGFRPCAVEMIR